MSTADEIWNNALSVAERMHADKAELAEIIELLSQNPAHLAGLWRSFKKLAAAGQRATAPVVVGKGDRL